MQSTPASFATDSQRWDALLQRNPVAEGLFVYAVKTTGVYCRPTCASRRPKRDNILFFQTCAEADRAGFRPCKRCKPNAVSPRSQQVQLIADMCKQIETTEEELPLKDLAAAAGLSPFHFHRLFKDIVGVTPKKYAVAQRAKRVRDELHAGQSVTEAIYNAGFGASSRFYAGATQILGMAPSQYQKGAEGVKIQVAVKPSRLGWVLVAATAQGVCAIEFGDSPEQLVNTLETRFPHAQFCETNPTFSTWVEQVVAYIATPERGLNLPLDVQGTAFQQRVWSALQDIPLGHTASYGEIAQRIGQPKAVRAVAQACAANKLAVAIPCHRVIASDGTLSGYRWGLERKRSLLEQEAQRTGNL